MLLSDLLIARSRINIAKIRPSAWACLSVRVHMENGKPLKEMLRNVIRVFFFY